MWCPLLQMILRVILTTYYNISCNGWIRSGVSAYLKDVFYKSNWASANFYSWKRRTFKSRKPSCDDRENLRILYPCLPDNWSENFFFSGSSSLSESESFPSFLLFFDFLFNIIKTYIVIHTILSTSKTNMMKQEDFVDVWALLVLVSFSVTKCVNLMKNLSHIPLKLTENRLLPVYSLHPNTFVGFSPPPPPLHPTLTC